MRSGTSRPATSCASSPSTSTSRSSGRSPRLRGRSRRPRRRRSYAWPSRSGADRRCRNSPTTRGRGLAPEPVQRANEDHLDEVVRALLAARLVPVLGPDTARSGRPVDAPWEQGVSSFAPADDELAEHLARYFSLPGAGGLARVSQL